MVLHYSKQSGVVLLSIRYAVSQGCLPPFCAFFLDDDNNDIECSDVECTVEALSSLLESASDQPERDLYVSTLEEADG